MRPKLISLAIHVCAIAALLLVPFGRTPTLENAVEGPKPSIRLHLVPKPLPAPQKEDSGAGSQAPTPATKGRLPLFARQPFLLPTTPTETVHPLMIEPTIAVDLPTQTVSMPNIGDPFAKIGPPSTGMGRGGIGDGDKGKLGDGDGPGSVGYRTSLGNSLTGPVPIYNPDPEFSEQARKAKLQGQVILEVVVDTDGRAHEIRVRNGLGLGLDEKAIEAVQTWKFRPGRRNGKAIPVAATIYINFRLL